jgi:large subunit ribosomal protein L23
MAKKTISTSNKDLTWVLKKPRITEKAALKAEAGVYVFEVSKDATKSQIAEAVAEIYKVTPVAVNIAKTHAKKVVRRKTTGTTTGYKSGIKKAYVYLKKGDTIELV